MSFIELLEHLKALQRVAIAAQLLQVKGYRGGVDPCVSRKEWDELQAEIERLPDGSRVSYATADMIP